MKRKTKGGGETEEIEAVLYPQSGKSDKEEKISTVIEMENLKRQKAKGGDTEQAELGPSPWPKRKKREQKVKTIITAETVKRGKRRRRQPPLPSFEIVEENVLKEINEDTKSASQLPLSRLTEEVSTEQPDIQTPPQQQTDLGSHLSTTFNESTALVNKISRNLNNFRPLGDPAP